MRSLRIGPFLSVVLVLGCVGEALPPARPTPVAPPQPAQPLRRAAPAAPSPPPGPRSISGDLPAVAVADLEAAGALACPPTCEADDEVSQLGPDLRFASIAQEGATEGPPVVSWFQIIHPGAAFVVARHEGVDLLGVVLSGRATIALTDRPRTEQPLEPWAAFLLPEGGASLRADGDAPVALSIVSAADDYDVLRRRGRPPRARRRGGLVVHPMGELPDLAWAGGAFHARIAFEAPQSPRVSLGVLIGSADAPVPEHDHPTSWELLSVVAAAGALRIPGQPVPGGAEGARVAEHDRTVVNGKAVLVPTGVRHEWRPAGSTPLVAIQSFAPPGPEQRFRALAAATGQ